MTAKRKQVSRDDPEQSKRFIEAARDLGSDETGDAFERAFKTVTRKRRPSADRTEKDESR